MWNRIERQMKSFKISTNLNNNNALSNLKTMSRYKAIRVFVSSTFTDFFNEREVLVKNVKKNLITLY